ncbi:LysE family translocator [Oceanimonas sp. NS1]|uniref:Lysine transporter LysE n=1 Tax=Oceanimonas doudoroffii TaxID=84158 RepID=A0A233RBB0_9GAMM|nr:MULTISPECIES: LysE family translocator [Oceanimonas]MCT7655087.1 LysE family translocator [Oceanimonas sp. NS1]NHH99587.1 Cysteine/O-acetylserine efflux protein [Oceanimonas sp. MB9]OXY80680.1 lysine transporter LysE [Oceanimonas doudoroffii]
MDIALLGPVAGFALAACGTPGPNNLLLASAGSRFGYIASLRLLLGIMLGLQGLLLLTALGLGRLFELWPALQWALKLAGSAYLLWLAWRIAMASAPDAGERSMSWGQGALFQFLNPKSWLMAISAISGFTLAGEHYWPSALAVLGVFLFFGMVTGHLWALLGMRVRRWLRTEADWRRFNRAMGALTAACVAMIWY